MANKNESAGKTERAAAIQDLQEKRAVIEQRMQNSVVNADLCALKRIENKIAALKSDESATKGGVDA